MNDSSRMQVLLYDKEQRGSISTWYYLHITECQAMGYIHHSKNPNICSWRMSSMSLIVPVTKGEYVFKPVLLHTFLTLWRNKDSSICTTCPENPNSKGASRFMSRQLHTSRRYLVALNGCHLRDLCLLSSISNWVLPTPLMHKDKPLLEGEF